MEPPLLEKKEGNFVSTFKLNTAKNSFSYKGKSLCPKDWVWI